MYSPETQSRISTLRSKCADGSITPEELREGIKLMREDRFSAVTSSAAAGSKKKTKAPVNIAQIFDDLDKL